MSVLGVVGIADKGVYSATATYKKMNFVLYNGSTWLALNDNLTGVTPEEGANWKYLARGWAAELLSMISAIDTSGLIGTAGATVTGQALIDEIADRVATKLILKTAISNQQVNDTTKVTGSALSYAMNQTLSNLSASLDATNVNLLKRTGYIDITKAYGTHDIDAQSYTATNECWAFVRIYATSGGGTFYFNDTYMSYFSASECKYGAFIVPMKTGDKLSFTKESGASVSAYITSIFGVR